MRKRAVVHSHVAGACAYEVLCYAQDDTLNNMLDLLPVWRASLPYLRARKNDVHVPISFHLALELLKSHPEADAEIVQLAILLHDNGWARIDAQEIADKAFGTDMKTMLKSDVRRLHETIGMELAQEVLGATGYAQARIDPVVAIIDGHDSRSEWFSIEDALVKDADKLWRFTTTGVSVACDWFKYTPARYVQHLIEGVRPSLITPAAGALADAALSKTRAELMTDILG